MIKNVIAVRGLSSYDGVALWDVFRLDADEAFRLYRSVHNRHVWAYETDEWTHVWEDTASTDDDTIKTLRQRLREHIRSLDASEQRAIYREDEEWDVPQYLRHFALPKIVRPRE